jgi:tight adherence protein B
MTNQLLLLLFAAPVLSGLLLLRVMRSDRRRQFAQQRLHVLTLGREGGGAEPPPSLARTVRRATSSSLQLPRRLGAGLDAALEATGNKIGLLHLMIAAPVAAIIPILLTSVILQLDPLVVVLSGAVSAVGGPVLLLLRAKSRYQNRFLDVFPDALDLIGRGVKAGLPVNEALVVASREIADPVGGELRRALDQVEIGVQMIDALQEMANRIRVADFRFLVVTLALQARTGGSLAETLGNLSGVIRARKALRLKAKSLSSEAKASAVILALLPFLVGGAMYVFNRDLTSVLITDPRGRFMVGVAFLSLVAGLTTMAVIIRRAVR